MEEEVCPAAGRRNNFKGIRRREDCKDCAQYSACCCEAEAVRP